MNQRIKRGMNSSCYLLQRKGFFFRVFDYQLGIFKRLRATDTGRGHHRLPSSGYLINATLLC